MKKSTKRVALSLHYQFLFGQRIVAAILRQAAQRRDWRIVTPYLNTSLETIAGNPDAIDGAIVSFYDHTHLRMAVSMRKPLVEAANTLQQEEVPAAYSDEAEVGRMAARYLHEKGYRDFAYCGFRDHHYSVERQAHFHAEVARLGGRSLGDFEGPWYDAHDAPTMLDRLEAWLKALPRPTAVFCCSDFRALHVHQACQRVGLRLSDDIGLLGVDDEQGFMEMYGCPLSSVAQDVEGIGAACVELLDAQMEGAPLRERRALIPPLRVVERASTEHAAVGDPLVSQALRLIRQHAERPYSVKELVASLPASRRLVERRFQEALGRSPNEEILRLRLARAQDLLHRTDLSLKEVAAAVGYEEQRYLTHLFKTRLGVTPLAYRQRLANGHAAG